MARKRQYGSIRKLPSGKWQARYLDRLTNRMVPASTTFATRGDASRWLAAMETGAIDARTVKAQRNGDRFEDYALAWVASRKLRPRTRELYEGQLRLHILPTLGPAIDKVRDVVRLYMNPPEHAVVNVRRRKDVDPGARPDPAVVTDAARSDRTSHP